ncbi:MAG: TIGR03759 family integrating conjugative element protein [Shewanella sp.]
MNVNVIFGTILLLVLSCQLNAATVNQDQTETQIISDEQRTVQNKEQQATRFGLSVTEWNEYERVMASSQGWEMKNSHPLAVLGRSATTEAEREKYARLLVKHEYQLAEGLLAFDRARTSAWKAMYPNLPIIRNNTPERVALYVNDQCDTCSQLLQQWRSKGSKVDIYFVGKGDDTTLREWAMRAGIRKHDVDEQQITLNHDDGSWLTVAKAKPIPVSLAKNKEGAWSFVTP